MATVRKRGNSYYVEAYGGSDSQGNPIRYRATFTPTEKAPTKIQKELSAFVSDFEEKIRTSSIYDGSRLTFRQYAEKWLAGYAVHNVSQGVREEYSRMLEKRILPAIGSVKLSELVPLRIQDFYDGLSADGLKPSSVKRHHAVINSIMKNAYQFGVIRENPCERCILPKVTEKYKYTIWNPEQVKVFLHALEADYKHYYAERIRQDSAGNRYAVASYSTDTSVSAMFQALYYLAIYSGARRGELAALTWEDLDLKKSEVRISKAVSRTIGSGQIEKDPKTAAGFRKITLPSSCMEKLKLWRREMLTLYMHLGSLWHGHERNDFDKNHIFIQRDSGLPINVDTISKKFQDIVQMYNDSCEDPAKRLPVIRFHDVRHTSASLMIANNIDVVTVSHRLGHAKPSTTMDIYSHALPSNDKHASDVLDALISG